MDWDEEQLSVINDEKSSRQIVEAGPGTGKTAVACARVASLIDVHEVPPSKIWLLSFTRTAVREIRNRIEDYVDDFCQDYDEDFCQNYDDNLAIHGVIQV